MAVLTHDALSTLRNPERLATLRATGPLDGVDAAFDRFTRLTATLLHAPISLLSLIDDEAQRVRSQYGLPEPWAVRREIPLAYSICKHVIELGEAVIAGDAAAHEVVGPVPGRSVLGVGAYIGVPLLVGGQAVGVLCAIDVRPRQWQPSELEVLKDLAAAASAELELRLTAAALQEKDEQLRDLLERASEMIVSVADDGVLVFANEAVQHALGYSAEEMVGRYAREFIAPEYRAAFWEAGQRIVREGEIRDFEAELLARGGGRVRVSGSGNCRFENGRPVATRLIFRDITAQRHVEEEIELIQRVTAAMTGPADMADALADALRELCEFGGWERGEVWLCTSEPGTGRSVCSTAAAWPRDAEHPAAAVVTRELVRHAVDSEQVVHLDYPLEQRETALALPILADGAVIGVLTFYVTGSSGQRRGTAALEAMAERLGPMLQKRRAQAELTALQESQQDFLDTIADLVMSVAPDGQVIYANRAWRETLEYAEADLPLPSVSDILPQSERARFLHTLQRVLRGEVVNEIPAHFVTRSGRVVEVEGSCSARVENGRVVSTRAIFRNVTARRQAELELRKSEHRLASILQTVEEGIVVVDADGRIMFGNPAAERILGLTLSELEDRTYDDPSWHIPTAEGAAFPPEELPFARVKATLAPVVGVEHAIHYPDGRRSVISINGAPLFSDEGEFAGMVASVQDVTERRTAIEALRDRERQLAEAQKIARLGSWEWNIRTGEVQWSDELREIYGVPARVPVTRELYESLIHPRDRERVRAAVTQALEYGRSYAFEHDVVRADGEVRTVYATGAVYPGADGKPVRLAGISQDVTDRRAAEELLRRNARMLELATDAIIIHVDGIIRYWNRGAERLYGWSTEEALGQYVHDFLMTRYPQDRAQVDAQVAAESRWSGELLHTRKDGSQISVDSRWTMLREEGAEPVILQIDSDVTERKRMQELFGAVLRAATQNCIIGTDTEGVITAFNAGAERILGYGAEEVVGRATPPDFMDTAELEERAAELGVAAGFEVFASLARQGIADTREWTFVRKDGSRLPVSLTVTPMRDEHGAVTGFLGMGVDVTRQRRIEEALRLAKDAAETAATLKSEFLAHMSHEIRTPMNAIMGMTDLLLDTDPTREQREYLELVRDSADSLLRILDDILDFSRIEAGMLRLEPHPFRLRQTIGDTIRTLAVRAGDKGLELSLAIADDVPDRLVGDAGRLRQVLVNLVSNAIKFTAAGKVEVSVWADDDATTSAITLHVAVHDTGIGIAPDRVGSIFEPFVQADASTTRRYGGTGLGLSISSQLVSLMHGMIEVESKPGRGSTFHFTARLVLATEAELHDFEHASALALADEQELRQPPAASPAAEPETRRLRVLLAEDNPVNQRLAQVLLEKYGYEVTLAVNGFEAVDRWAEQSFDAVLMDLQMPELDGLEATSQIRERERQRGGHTPIIALTAHARASDRERCLAGGMDRYLPKPLDVQTLLATLSEVTGWQPSRAAVAAPEGIAPHDERHVEPPPEAPPLDERERLLALFDGDSGLLEELAGLFRADAPLILGELRAALAAGNTDGARNLAHRLKGAAAVFASHEVVDAASALEHAAAAGEVTQAIGQLEQLEAGCERLLEALTLAHV